MVGNIKTIDFNKVDDSTYDMLGGKNLEQFGQDNEAPFQDEEHLKVQNIPQSQRAYA